MQDMLEACPFNAIDMVDKKAVIQDSCTLCGACVSSCRFEAIELEKDETEAAGDISAYRGVWVFAEQKDGEVANVVLELLGEGRKLAVRIGEKLSAVLPGDGMEAAARKLVSYGADNVYMVDHPSLKRFNDESYADIFTQLIEKYKPEIVLRSDDLRRSLAPRVASRLNRADRRLHKAGDRPRKAVAAAEHARPLAGT